MPSQVWHFDSKKASKSLENIYFEIKNITDDILEKYNNKNYLLDPSVNIEVIAKDLNIKIEYVSPEHKNLNGERAAYDKYTRTIYVNSENSKDEQRFSIAHEIGHALEIENKIVNKYKDILFDVDIPEEDNINYKVDRLVSRIDNNSLKTDKIVSEISKISSSLLILSAYDKMGKFISIKKANNVLYDEIHSFRPGKKNEHTDVNKIKERIYNNALTKAIKEEIVDYFAANLLIPTGRFLLWENKLNYKIARAFGVNKRCIKKRREEIVFEQTVLKPQKISSGIKLDEKAPLTRKEVKQFFRGYFNALPGKASTYN